LFGNLASYAYTEYLPHPTPLFPPPPKKDSCPISKIVNDQHSIIHSNILTVFVLCYNMTFHFGDGLSFEEK
jgi:hypothetical protein